MSTRGEMLVAILNNLDDFALARDQHWYRIPVSSMHKWLKNRWPPQWLSFYQTKIFGQEAFAIHYYTQVLHIRQVSRWHINAERQEFVTVKKEIYALDFAIYCAEGKLDIETDGDTWHANPERAPQDNVRDNALETGGWKVLRFNTSQIREKAEQYCLPTVVENINKLGGLDEGNIVSTKISLNTPPGTKQLGLF